MITENPTISGMAEVLSPIPQIKAQKAADSVANRPSSLSRSRSFKYYIHDSVPTLRFQLIGDLHAASVRELNGSWETARTTLNARRFLLDLSQLHSTDDEGRAWLLKMKDAGAQFQPVSYLDSPIKASERRMVEQVPSVKLSLVGRVMGLFRSER